MAALEVCWISEINGPRRQPSAASIPIQYHPLLSDGMGERVMSHGPLPGPILNADAASDKRVPNGVPMESG